HRHSREALSAHRPLPGCALHPRRATTLRTHNKGGLNMRTCLISRVVWCLVALVLVLGAALTVTAQQAAAPIQVAWAGPLTGDVAQLGQGYLNGIKLAFDEWNAKGGVLGGRKFVVVAEDDACDPKQAGTVAQKIADDPKNNVFIGHMCSGTTLA